MTDPEISGGGGYQPSWGSGGQCKSPVGSRSFAPGYQTKCNFTYNVFNYH